MAADPAPAPDAPISIGADIVELQRAKVLRKRKLLMIGGAIAVLIGVAVLVRFLTTRSDLPPIPAAELKKIQEALPQMSEIAPEHRNALGMAAIGEVEGGRLPTRLVKGFADAANAGPVRKTMVLLEALADPAVLAEWSRTCSGGTKVLAEMAWQPDVAQGRSLYKECNLDRLGFLSESEAARVEGPVLAATSLAHDYLKRHNALSETEVALLRLAAVDSLIHAKENHTLDFQF